MATANEAGSAHGTGRGVMDRVRSGATEQLSTQKDRATEGLGSLARAVRETTRPLRDNQQDTLAQYAEKAADQIERFSARLRDRDVTELVAETQQFARRRPAIFLGAAFAAGVIAARFLKSSSEARARGYRAGEGNADPRTRPYAPGGGYGGMQTPYSTATGGL